MADLFRVSAQSRAVSLAGAIAGTIRDGKAVTLQAIGADSVNQAIKAIAIARHYLARDGLDVICVPEYLEIYLDGKQLASVRFHVDQPGHPFPPARAIPLRETWGDDPPHGPEAGQN